MGSPERAVIVRSAHPDDVPELLRMGREFYAFARCADHGLGYDEESLSQTFEELALNGLLAVADQGGRAVGMVAALLIPWYADRRQAVAQEVWLWADPAARRLGAGRLLLDALEAWAEAHGAALVQMATPGVVQVDPVVERWYRRRGYRFVESAWARRV